MKLYRALFLIPTVVVYAADHQDAEMLYAETLRYTSFAPIIQCKTITLNPFVSMSTMPAMIVDSQTEAEAQALLTAMKQQKKTVREVWVERGTQRKKITKTWYISDDFVVTKSQQDLLMRILAYFTGNQDIVLDNQNYPTRAQLLIGAFQDIPYLQWESYLNQQLVLYACKKSSNRISDLQ